MTQRARIGRETHEALLFEVDDSYRKALEQLPWRSPIDEWRSLRVKHLDIKRGVGRHPLVFVEVDRLQFAVKQLGYHASLREVANYRAMLERGVHTLIPVGCVSRREHALEVSTRIGRQYEQNIVAHTVTLLTDRVLPDSQLYRRSFRLENRKRIWDAIVDLFVELHTNGIYWGDASLANTLVKFLKVEIPYVGKKTRLKAYLADAETVEIHENISDSLRQSDVDFFLESMEWIDEELRASGVLRDKLATEEDKRYLLEGYKRMFEVGMKSKEFQRATGLSVQLVLGHVQNPEYLEILGKHIDEHKWYLSEERGPEVPLLSAAQDWLQSVFTPICELFREEGVLGLFPGKTASELYVEIMTNKYYLSRERGRDVGMLYATRDYARRFGKEPRLSLIWHTVADKMLKILGLKAHLLLGTMQ